MEPWIPLFDKGLTVFTALASVALTWLLTQKTANRQFERETQRRAEDAERETKRRQDDHAAQHRAATAAARRNYREQLVSPVRESLEIAAKRHWQTWSQSLGPELAARFGDLAPDIDKDELAQALKRYEVVQLPTFEEFLVEHFPRVGQIADEEAYQATIKAIAVCYQEPQSETHWATVRAAHSALEKFVIGE